MARALWPPESTSNTGYNPDTEAIEYLPHSADTTDYPDPKIIVLGVTGTGKSTLCNALAGKNPDGKGQDDFPTSAHPDICTYQTTIKVVNWLGTGEKFTLIDTPGLDDPRGKDSQNIAQMVENLKKIKYVHAFVIVFNGQQPRFDRSLTCMLKIFRDMFGSHFIGNTIIEFSRWSFDERSQDQRDEKEISEAKQAKEWNAKFRQEIGPGQELPVVYIDARYREKDEKEVEAFKQQTDKLWDKIQHLEPFECKDIEAVLAEVDALLAEIKKAENKYLMTQRNLEEAQQQKRITENKYIQTKRNLEEVQHQKRRAEAEASDAWRNLRVQKDLYEQAETKRKRAQHDLDKACQETSQVKSMLCQAEQDKRNAEKRADKYETEKTQALIDALKNEEKIKQQQQADYANNLRDIKKKKVPTATLR